jgi:hypothetical protein
MTARKISSSFVSFALVAVALVALHLFTGTASASPLFEETFDGYTSFPDEHPAGDPVNFGLPEISEGADELWYGGRFQTPDNGTIQQDIAVQSIGGTPNGTPVGRVEDEAGLIFNVSTLGFLSASLDFDWRLFSASAPDTLRAGYFVGTITGWAGDRTKSFVGQWGSWTQIGTKTTSTWSHVSTTLPGNEVSVWVAFWLDNGEGDFGKIDNIVVVSGQQVPEPTTFVLAGFGVAAVGSVAVQRRRARKGFAAVRADHACDVAGVRANRA